MRKVSKIFNSFLFVYLIITGIILFSCGSGNVEEPEPELKTPNIYSLSPKKGCVGDTIKITGGNFGNMRNEVAVYFGTLDAEIVDFSNKEITFKIPGSSKPGEFEVFVKVGDLKSNSILFQCEEETIAITRVIDKQLWFVDNSFNQQYKEIPTDPDFYYFSGFPTIPGVQPVPQFPWDEENFSSGNRGFITDNVYIEPGWDKPWVLQLSISTTGQADTQTGSAQYKVWYRTSNDNANTFSPLKQVIIDGYTSMNPIEGVEIGRNGYNVNFTTPIVRASNGEIIVPVNLTPWDENNNKIYLPIHDAFFFQDAGALIGKWLPDASDVEWFFGEWLRIDHNKSTRGLSESTIVELNEKGRFAMISRGSNRARLELPCYAWVSLSNDYCRTWSEPVPFTYSNGESFFVTTSQSALFKSKVNGKTYWIGNLQHTNPQAAHPRYPLVIGEVDLNHFGLIEESVVEIDTRHPSDGEDLQLSNFKILEHKTEPEIVVVLRRIEGTGTKVATRDSWYRIKLE